MTHNTEYLVVLEKAEHNWSAYSPDVDGCISTGSTVEQTRHRFGEGLQGHLSWMQEDGDAIPVPNAQADTVVVALPGFPPRRYPVILKTTLLGDWSVFAADVPELVLTFSERAAALCLLTAALQSHFEALRENGKILPEATSEIATVSVRLAEMLVAA
jgi:predicted RNase H-like HicB family nuclease